MTEISKYGEFGLIKHLTEKIKLQNASSLKGVGDDAAVLDYKDKRVLVTTDLLLEGIHFDLTYTPLKHLGYKAAVVNFSDIYAMNGQPKQITVSLGVSKRFSVEDLEEIYAGIYLACEKYGVDLGGGDTSASLTGLTISITCIGEGEEGNIVYRNGAKANDLICVTGDLGSAYMGLQLLEREKMVFSNHSENIQPDFEEKKYILKRQLKPEARKDIIDALRKKGIVPSAMMDISDGIASDLKHILKASSVSAKVDVGKLPISQQLKKVSEAQGWNYNELAISGGEDYELLFTIANEQFEALSADYFLTFGREISVIGNIVEGIPEIIWMDENKEVEFKRGGFNHFE